MMRPPHHERDKSILDPVLTKSRSTHRTDDEDASRSSGRRASVIDVEVTDVEGEPLPHSVAVDAKIVEGVLVRAVRASRVPGGPGCHGRGPFGPEIQTEP